MEPLWLSGRVMENNEYVKQRKIQGSLPRWYNFLIKKLPPYTPVGLDLTTHTSRLLDGRRRRYLLDHAARANRNIHIFDDTNFGSAASGGKNFPCQQASKYPNHKIVTLAPGCRRR
jgi:hypothetical protein